MGAQVENLQYGIKAIKNGQKKMLDTIVVGITKAARIVYNKSQELVPVDTGELKASGKIVVVKGTSAYAAYALVVYSAEHAVWVHEILDRYHKPPTQARYLADAVKKSRGTITAMLKNQMLEIKRWRIPA